MPLDCDDADPDGEPEEAGESADPLDAGDDPEVDGRAVHAEMLREAGAEDEEQTLDD